MKIPLSWLKDFVEISLTPEELAYKLTFGGMEVEEIEYVGLPQPERKPGEKQEFKTYGISWAPEKIVTAQVLEVGAHPNADRLTLLRLDDGSGKEQTVLTGAPNLFPYKGAGPLAQPIKVAYAREGSVLYDGHKPGRELMTLKKAKIRGVESYSMVCSEKELGISEEHEGIIFLDEDAPVGVPLADYMGDAVFTIKTNPNMARNINVYGVAREIAALTGQPLKPLSQDVVAEGVPIEGQISLQITNPDLNPRFVAALIKGVTIKPSSYQVQRRLRLCGVRPINNIVDVTNYAMLEVGQPLHAFDYDVLVSRAAPNAPTIITRTATAGETLKTLDGVERKLDDFTILVCDEKGALGLGGVMGGLESEVSDQTTSVLLEGAAWEFINIRKTMQAQKLSSEAGYRFSRGVHPAMTTRGVKRGIELMRQWGGGTVARGLVEAIAKPTPSVSVAITPAEVERILGIQLSTADIVRILESLQFTCEIQSQISNPQSAIQVTVPDHRLDIGTGVVGQADVIEEIARIYGYERIPETQLADDLPPQRRNLSLEVEEQARDILVNAGLQEVMTYSLTTPERERRVLSPTTPADERPYVTLLNPIASDRTSMRHSLLASVLEIAAANVRLSERLALFEIAPVYIVEEEESLPQEPRRLTMVLTGQRERQNWQAAQNPPMDFFDVKGVIESLLDGLHIANVSYAPGTHPTFLPGRTAELHINGQHAGWLGELHPRVREHYDLPNQAVLVADLDFEVLAAHLNERYPVRAVPEFPPVKEDLALVLDEAMPAAQVQAAIRDAGGNLLAGVTLFDVYRDEKLGAGKKSLAFSLTYQAPDRTLTDSDVAKVRAKIVKKLQDELGASLRG
ncbi:MAG: phenylalanine--tRNA ligase subunit beta [Anaerolineales bacterium]|nr:phenylalanine--tRNA ligase subunit beta [Anaerolineales bacterium]